MSDMYNFDNNNYNNENHYEFDENNNNTPNHKKPNAKMVKFAKKVGAIALSAVLFGGVAAGSYQGVNALFGTSTQTEALFLIFPVLIFSRSSRSGRPLVRGRQQT